jgi:TatD DNase family protein
MSLIDSHAHLTFEVLAGDLAGVLTRAADAGVEHVVTIGTGLDDSRQAVELAAAYADVSAVAGIHPHEAAEVTRQHVDGLRDLLDSSHVVGIGEMGLDYHYTFADRRSQRRVLEAQLDIASTRQLPLVIHCRDAVHDTVSILSAAGFDRRPVVFHCFTGTRQEAEVIDDHGWWISFAGIVTFKNAAALQDIARTYPADQLMIETDCPYLSPVPVRSVKANEPAHLVHTARFLANLRDEAFDTLAAKTVANTRRFFGLA